MSCRILALRALAILLIAACGSSAPSNEHELEVLASRYASAWSSQDPARLASFYAEDGVLRINDGEPAVGRKAIEDVAQSFMASFPDMAVEKVRVVFGDGTAEFHWRWTGTNNGPGGTGLPVDMTGFEEWTFDEEGKIARSQGHFDEDEYARQMGADES